MAQVFLSFVDGPFELIAVVVCDMIVDPRFGRNALAEFFEYFGTEVRHLWQLP